MILLGVLLLLALVGMFVGGLLYELRLRARAREEVKR